MRIPKTRGHLGTPPSVRTLACYYQAGHAVAAVALRGPEAVEWAAVLPSRKLAGIPTMHPKHRHGATKLALAPIASPRHHPLIALDDAVIAMAGARAQHRHRPSIKVRLSEAERLVVAYAWDAFCGRTRAEEIAFESWLYVRADMLLYHHWSAVESVAKTLDAKNEVSGREVAAEVAAARVGSGR